MPAFEVANARRSSHAPVGSIDRRRSRHIFLASVSLLGMLVASNDAVARALNGGGSGGSFAAPNIAADAASAAARQAAEAAQQTQQSLARAARSVQDMQAVQSAARAAAAAAQMSVTAPIAVPNGLGVGGLDQGTHNWGNAAATPTQSSDGKGRTEVTIRQLTQQAILNWQSFNVGARTTLTFDQQGNSNWVALNRVTGVPGQAIPPSQILGNIKADGHVYVINQSGIIFGGNSQVNVGSLIASTAGITDAQFRANGIYSPTVGSGYGASFSGARSAIKVEAGALIATHEPRSVTQGGGFVMLLGTEVENAGQITTRKGQTLLAAGDDFLIRRGMQITGVDAKGVSIGTNVYSTVRGNEVSARFKTEGSLASGKTTNSGLIVAREGDVTLTGREVRQDGVAIATSTVNIRGTIHLSNAANDADGRVTLGANALTAIAIEDTSPLAGLLGVTAEDARRTALDAQREALVKESATLDQQRIAAAAAAGFFFDNYSTLSDRRDLSRIEIVGGALVDVAGGSFTLATGGQITMQAGNSAAGTKDNGEIRRGEIRVQKGAELDVSGRLGVRLAMESNNVLINIQGNELRDAPINRDQNVLRNASVWVDLRGLIYVPAGTNGYASDRWYTKGGLLEVGGYLGQRGHGIGEWTAQGGIVTFSSDRVDMQAGARLNMAGGSLDYAGGYIYSTNLVGSDGRRYSIDNAPADLLYANFAGGFRRSHNIQGREDSRLTEIWTTLFDRGRTSMRWEDGYRVGRDAGRFNVQAVDVRLDGSIEAMVHNGLKQIEARPAGEVADGYKLGQTQAALPGLLSLQTYDPNAGSFNPRRSWSTTIRIGNTLPDADEGGDNFVWVNLDRINEARLGGVAVKSRSRLVLDGDLTLAPGGLIDWAGMIELDGSLTARGGSVKLVSSGSFFTNGTTILPGKLTLKAGHAIDIRGLWSNAALDPANAWQAAFRNGGAVSLDTNGGSLIIEPGSRIDASAGAAVSSMTAYKGGAGGDISLSSGMLTLDGTLASSGFTRGGKLTIATREAISIGGKLLENNGRLGIGEKAPFELMLAVPTWFEVGETPPFPYSLRADHLNPGDNARNASGRLDSTNLVIIGSSGWVVPDGSLAGYFDPVQGGNVYVSGGSFIQPGTPLTYLQFSSNDYLLPVDAFPHGLPIVTQVTQYAAGTTLKTQRYLAPVGTVIPSGAKTEKTLDVYRTLDIANAASFFRQGFSSYDLSSAAGLIVQPGMRMDVVQPVLQFTSTDYLGLGGDALARTAASYLQPEHFLENPGKAALTQRPGADLSLSGGAPYFLRGTIDRPPTVTNGGLRISEGAIVSVDPGRRIALKGLGQITVDGTVAARGGEIAVVNTRGVFLNVASDLATYVYRGPGTASVLVGSKAVLDVSGIAVTARDRNGRSYGVVRDGGSIILGGQNKLQLDANQLATSEAWVIIRSGALLDASGASAVLDFVDPFGGGFSGARSEARQVSSHGGSIALSSYSGLFIDGELRAKAGGAGASGGSLSVAIETPVYVGNFAIADVSSELLVGRQLTIGQDLRSGRLAADSVAGKADPGLVIGTARIAATQIANGGFDAVTLWGRNGLVFDGDVSLQAGHSLTLAKGALLNTTAGGNVSLAAPYVRLEGWTRPVVFSIDVFPSIVPALPMGGTFTIAGQLVDVRHDAQSAYDLTRLESTGDLRLLASIFQTKSGSVDRRTTLVGANRLELAAAQLYAASNAIAEISAGSVLSIEGQGGAASSMPYSVFANLTLRGQTIRQGGIVRAPLGDITFAADKVELLAGSITSVSARGLLIPYGGSADGQVYLADGTAVKAADLIGDTFSTFDQGSITVKAGALVTRQGALFDLSGGGTLLGGAFVSGRGGSVDTLLYPRVAGNKVFAIAPGIVTAPVAGGYTSAWTGAVPQIGEQITIPAGVPGLAAGTYTLLPANYALLPGAFRIELGGAAERNVLPYAAARRDGSWAVAATTGIAGTGIVDALPRNATITSAEVFKTWSQYNTQSFAQFQIAQADRFGLLRPRLEVDGKNLIFAPNVMPDSATNSALVAGGSVDFSAAQGGYGGSFALVSSSQFAGPSVNLILTAPGSTTVNDATHVTVSAAAVNALGAPNLYIGGVLRTRQGTVTLEGLGRLMGKHLVLESGVRLNAAQVLLAADGRVTLGDGVEINTLGRGIQAPDSRNGLIFGSNPSLDARAAMLAVSNGQLVLNTPSGATGSVIELGNVVSLYSEGSIGFYSDLGVSLTGTPQFGTRNLTIAVPSFNIGTVEALAAAGPLPAGMVLNQNILDAILRGNPAIGAPAVENLILSATNSLNFFGGISLDTRDPVTGRSRLDQFVVNSPAIYGYGAASDEVRLITDTFVWNGNANSRPNPADFGNSLLWQSNKPGAVHAGGTGAGQFAIDADVIVLGYPTPARPNTTLSFDRLVLGFTDVAFNAGSRITANNRGTLSVYLAGTDPGTLESFDPVLYTGTGGTLHLNTPVLTGEAASSIAYHVGGPIRLASSGAAPAAMPGGLGAQISLNSDSAIDIASTIALQSGKLTLSAAGDVTLAGGARLDLSGRTVRFYDVTRATWGGELSLESRSGNIVQQSGAVIDLSAQTESAGTLTLSALSGAVRLDGALRASGGASHAGGAFDLRAGTLGGGIAALSDDFAVLNAKLSDAGFFAARAFTFKQGDLVIGDGLKARDISVAMDAGSLTVLGHVDASGAVPGSIRLAARDDLTLGSSAILDAHGRELQRDSYGQTVEARNRGTVELTSSQGWLRLLAGATINLASSDGIARGRIDLNAGRSGETSGDVRIDANAPLNIAGAGTIALNAFWTYHLPGGSVIDQARIDGYDAANSAFMNAAYDNGTVLNATLQGRLGGLLSYGSAFHLRPGVAITSDGDLSTSGDIDLSRYRYGPNRDRDPASGSYGRGEPMALTVRAGGDLNIKGSISDGFGPDVPDTPPAYIGESDIPSSPIFNVQPGLGWGYPADYYDAGNATYYIVEDWTIPNHALFSESYGFYGFYDTKFKNYMPGDTIPAGTQLVQGFYPVDAGFSLPRIASGRSELIPGASSSTPRAPMLAAGSLSASIRLVAGADLTGADPRALKPLRGQAYVPARTEFSGMTDVKRNSDFTLDSSWGVGDLYMFTGSGTYYFTEDWTVPNTAGYRALADNFMLVDQKNTPYAPGSVVPKGTTFQAWQWGFDASDPIPNLASRLIDMPARYSGAVLLNDPRYVTSAPVPSVIRTGTGSLDILAASNVTLFSDYGIYTAGTDTKLNSGNEVFNRPRQNTSGTVYYPDHGGDLFVAAQGALTGYSFQRGTNRANVSNSAVGDWLWRQGGAEIGEETAWGINFGAFVGTGTDRRVAGFSGFGALGGGNVMLRAGDDAGNLSAVMMQNYGSDQYSSSLIVAVGATGRIQNGLLTQTGGGDVTVRIGGRLNPALPASLSSVNELTGGVFTNLRGGIDISAGSIGNIDLAYGTKSAGDPRATDLYEAGTIAGLLRGGPVVVPGDGAVALRSRGDLVFGNSADATMQINDDFSHSASVMVDGVLQTGANRNWFSLWTKRTAVSLMSAGGNLAPFADNGPGFNTNGEPSGGILLMPARFDAAAASGSIYYGSKLSNRPITNELVPSADGQFELLAMKSIYAAALQGPARFTISGASDQPDFLPNPFKPAFVLLKPGVTGDFLTDGFWATNTLVTLSAPRFEGGPVSRTPKLGYFAFQPDLPTRLHAGDETPMHIYAVKGDIVDLRFGNQTGDAAIVAAKAAQIRAGRDIVRFGSGGPFDPVNLILNANATDVSVLSAGRDILYANLEIAGPGSLEVTAGRNIYQGELGSIVSIGRRVSGDIGLGASILMQAGAGPAGPNYAGLLRYLDPANLADDRIPLIDQPGKVARTYQKELIDWLQQRYGYAAVDAADAKAYFDLLKPEQQHIFLRLVYFAELRDGGREYNNTSSSRYSSYVRGRLAIAALFPEQDAAGNAIRGAGDITMFSTRNGETTQDGSVRTLSGGDIELLAPHGRIIVGVEGIVPGANAGLVTQGKGNISLYSQGSILLGLSRIMTTYGGHILAWSATGDINAGRGAKTTIVYTPPKRTYDIYGNVELSPNVPASGAGIATLNPIPEVPPGDIDLIAPEGTIDAGEAGIRVSGNVNLAALQVLNAANIQVQGTSSGIPTVQAPSITAALSSANATAATQQTTTPQASANATPSVIIVEVLGYGGGEGGDTTPGREDDKRRKTQHERQTYNQDSNVRVLGYSTLSASEMSGLNDTEKAAIRN